MVDNISLSNSFVIKKTGMTSSKEIPEISSAKIETKEIKDTAEISQTAKDLSNSDSTNDVKEISKNTYAEVAKKVKIREIKPPLDETLLIRILNNV